MNRKEATIMIVTVAVLTVAFYYLMMYLPDVLWNLSTPIVKMLGGSE